MFGNHEIIGIFYNFCHKLYYLKLKLLFLEFYVIIKKKFFFVFFIQHFRVFLSLKVSIKIQIFRIIISHLIKSITKKF